MPDLSGPISQAVAKGSVIVCVGAGGVGKTTTAASIGLHAALGGKSALVCTIDPAKRLANSLGLKALGNTEARVPESYFREAGLNPDAPLFAMMLDIKQTWDELIARLAPPDQKERILSNRIYQALSTALAGSQEYIALEKLWQLRNQRDYGIIVLDTPPTAHALDFLEAPNRILDFLDNEAARWLLTPALSAGKVGLKLFNLGGTFIAKTLARITGTELLRELANFMLAIGGMNEDFRDRARGVRDLLTSEATAFILVTTPARERMEETVNFWRLLKDHRMTVAAIVVNRVHTAGSGSFAEELGTLAPTLAAKVQQTLHEVQLLAEADAKGLAELARRCHPTPLLTVPRFEGDVHDLKGLFSIGEALFREGA